jgi:hypothetical protein
MAVLLKAVENRGCVGRLLMSSNGTKQEDVSQSKRVEARHLT